MGLDSIDLVVAIEKAFDIKIPDSEAEKILTVGDMYNAVHKHINEANNHKCLTQKIFYHLRANMVSMGIAGPAAIKPQTGLETLIPLNSRYNDWQQLQSASGYKMPVLKFSGNIEMLISAVYIICFISIVGITMAVVEGLMSGGYVIYPLMLAGIIYGLNRLLDKRKTRFQVADMRTLISAILSMNKFDRTEMGRKDVELLINNIISDKNGIAMEEITPDKYFVKDLGIS